ncbi:MAG TPA: xanthine dehydrogenase family protein molybdopterin-binding subunit, partial [Kiloniellaceae bacterium]|nr:xanthine dehydrogenase family protein molybdopterin-binding subunit [Kiloniellaceae bacterium]
MTFDTTRRGFLAGAAAGVAVLSLPIAVPTLARAEDGMQPSHPMSYLRIGTDGTVTCILPTCEMGQGTHTGQAQILAEELGAEWESIRIEMPLQPGPDYRLPFGQMRSVGSYGIRHFHDPMRRAAAQARMMLTQAAAGRLGVAAQDLKAEGGQILHAASNRAIAFGDLVEDALALPVPADPVLRPDGERRLTGRSVPRLDTPAKVSGEAVFSIDVKRPDMLYGAVRLSPVFSADVARMNPESVRGMPGVVEVVPVPRGAVVVAESWWQAKKAADALDITFTQTAFDGANTPDMEARIRAGLDATDVPMTLMRGDAEAMFSGAAQVIEADYAVPMLAHVCMEPINCTAQATEGRTELWTGTQGHDWIRMNLERELGVPSDQLFINTVYLGGGFGRKTHPHEAIQAILASRSVGGRPVKVLWAREDDIQQGLYRQTMMIRLRAALSEDGRIAAMTARMSGPQMGAAIVRNNNMDPFSLLGLIDMPYEIANFSVDHAVVDIPVPLSPWRSIAASFTGYFVESFMDECAHAAGQDPLAFRLAHLPEGSRPGAVLQQVADMANWSEPAAEGISRGISVVFSYNSYVAQVVELRMQDERVRVEHVHAAIDCGRVINPAQVETQIQGSVV